MAANHIRRPFQSYVSQNTLILWGAIIHSNLCNCTETAPPPTSTASSQSASRASSLSLSSAEDGLASIASANVYETTLSDGQVVTVTPTPFPSTLSNGDVTTLTPTPSTSTNSDGSVTVVFSPTPNEGSLQSNDKDNDGTPTWAIVVPSKRVIKVRTTNH